jgi:hypothetical protein
VIDPNGAVKGDLNGIGLLSSAPSYLQIGDGTTGICGVAAAWNLAAEAGQMAYRAVRWVEPPSVRGEP